MNPRSVSISACSTLGLQARSIMPRFIGYFLRARVTERREYWKNAPPDPQLLWPSPCLLFHLPAWSTSSHLLSTAISAFPSLPVSCWLPISGPRIQTTNPNLGWSRALLRVPTAEQPNVDLDRLNWLEPILYPEL